MVADCASIQVRFVVAVPALIRPSWSILMLKSVPFLYAVMMVCMDGHSVLIKGRSPVA